MKKHLLAVGIIFLFIFSSFTPLSFGSNIDSTDESPNDIDPLQEYYGSYSLEEIPESIRPITSDEGENIDGPEIENDVEFKDLSSPLNGPPMDSAWAMYCHDVRHTGSSPYSTVDNSGYEVWRFKTFGSAMGGPVIDQDGIIYIGSHDLRAVYPNGTLKWTFDMEGWCNGNAPAIDENGTIYVGTNYGYLYAVNPDGTKKWTRSFEGDLLSSPALGDDGTIYIGNEIGYPLGGYINALYPNGTYKWRYKTNHVVYSSPAIGDDDTVYCGSHDTYLYALYPNNGTLKWRYKTGHWIRTSPCIADDGTIYVVSLDNYLHAVNPNGTLKWKTNMNEGGTSPTIGQDGTIYCGYTKLHAINPTNGSIKWTYKVSGNIKGSTPCHSLEDTIYFGTDGGWLYAVNSDGTLKWQEKIANEVIDSAPAIGDDGTVYIGSNNDYLYAFGIGPLIVDANGPYFGLINQPLQFKGYARGGYSPYVSWHWTFGDGGSSDEQNPIYTYIIAGNYSVTLTVTDNSDNSSSGTTWTQVQATNDPPNKPIIDGRKKGEPHQHYDYTFVTTEPEQNPIWYYVDWGDNTSSGWLGPYDSGHQITLTHTWDDAKIFIIKAKAKDIFDVESGWATFEVNLPRNKATINVLFLRFLEQFPLLNLLLQRLRI